MQRLISKLLLSLYFCLAPGAVAQERNIAEIVTAQDAYILNITESTREALSKSLAAYENSPTVETVNAHLILMANDIAAGDYQQMLESAMAARDHIEPVSNLLPKQYAEARYIAAVAGFSGDLDGGAMLEMAHVAGFTRSFRDETGEHPKWAQDLKWKSEAWRMAMDAYFETDRKRHPEDEEIDQILASYGVDAASTNASETQSNDQKGLPACSGRMIQRPKVRYPAGKAMRGRFGAVILGLEFDAAGNVINPYVLASVPFEEFDENSMRTVGQWRFKPNDPKQVGITCRLHRTGVIQPLVFQIR